MMNENEANDTCMFMFTNDIKKKEMIIDFLTYLRLRFYDFTMLQKLKGSN